MRAETTHYFQKEATQTELSKESQGTDSNPSTELAADEAFFIRSLLLLTGREDRLARQPIVEGHQLAGIRAVVPMLRSSTASGMAEEGKCDLFNRILLSLSIKPAAFDFFKIVFGNTNFSKDDEIDDRVRKFRCLCMLEYGSFRFGYKVLKFGGDSERGRSLGEMWAHCFPDSDQASALTQDYKGKPGPVGLIDIPPTQLFVLGYLASQQAKKINGARRKLVELIDEAISIDPVDYTRLAMIAKKEGIMNLGAFVASAGIPDTEKLLYPQFWAPRTPYKRVLTEVKESCVTVEEDAIATAQVQGRQNAETYLAMHDIDVYVATSMRDPLHFTTNNAFVTELFKRGELRDWNLRYFDPTQCFLPDRIQKGLTECLMIKRAEVTIYNAQESDTFGKDAEAAVALAQGKPVIAFVARLFATTPKFDEFYKIIDSAPRVSRDGFVSELENRNYISRVEAITLFAPEKTKVDSVDLASRKTAIQLLKELQPNEIMAELLRQGYEPPTEAGELVAFTAERIAMLEKRALTFKDIHPLSLQASPLDGVARGVIVTRSVKATAEVLRGLMIGTLSYEIVEQDANWVLLDKVTQSPVRAVTKNSLLTTAFWSEFSREKERLGRA